MAKVTLATGLIVFYGYCMEAFFGWYSANQFEQFMITNRMTGPYAGYYWALIICNGVMPQLLWSRKVRTSVVPLFAVCMVVNVGMWLERFVIVPTSAAPRLPARARGACTTRPSGTGPRSSARWACS